jgi:hypothetical protein
VEDYSRNWKNIDEMVKIKLRRVGRGKILYHEKLLLDYYLSAKRRSKKFIFLVSKSKISSILAQEVG